MSNKFKSISKRFAKAFLSGGVASLIVSFSQVPQFNTLEDFKTWLLALTVAFISGGLLAIEKAANWKPS